ncbi:hypothetical protein [Thermogemmatispora sp.]|uniref:hypothetical protein n=1 Tax=Thermogemmatispora sp. TaxID=1968838 RepID=UPI001E0C2463|nr:hypothetical protein [Thermogemmatispora sp.]MBX5452185.1 hypothetical protein [Thermogemmatispora sp.]
MVLADAPVFVDRLHIFAIQADVGHEWLFAPVRYKGFTGSSGGRPAPGDVL